MQELRALIGCGRPWAEQRAQMALQLSEAYSTGQISTDEYKELLQDLVRTDTLDNEADDMAVKAMLVTGVYGLLQVV
jgi:polyhydroxyalkanoate synthesis regulator phasin